MDANKALAEAHTEARLHIETARTVLRMAVMFPERMPPGEACERALDELDLVERVSTIIIADEPNRIHRRQMPDDFVFRPQELSAQQARIMALVAKGYTNAEIGKEMFLSAFTIKSHLSRAFKALGVHTRAEAVARMKELEHDSDPGTY